MLERRHPGLVPLLLAALTCMVAADGAAAGGGAATHFEARPGTAVGGEQPSGTGVAQSTPYVLIENVTVIDGTGRPPIEGAWVLLHGDRVARIARGPIGAFDPADLPGSPPPEAAPPEAASPDEPLRIDGTGKFLIPGLMDMHVHLSGGRGRAGPDFQAGIRALHGFLYSGVTTVFDAGNDPDFILTLRQRQREGEIQGPRIFATGPLVTVPGGHGASEEMTLVESWPGAREALDAHLALQPDMVKLTFDEHGWGTRPLIPLLPPELMQEIGRYVAEHGVRTTVHVSHEYRARQAVAAGIDTLAHPVIQGPVSDGFVRLMAARKVPMVSTLTIGEGYSRLVESPEYLERPLYRAVYEPEHIERLRTEVRDRWAARPWTTWMKVMTPVAQENLRRIHEAGGVIVLGSDQSAGPQSHRELELLVEGGIDPVDAIRIGTLNAAVFLGRADETGSVEEGKRADLVLLSADPLADISNLQEIEAVILGGRVVDRSTLDLPVNRRETTAPGDRPARDNRVNPPGR